MKKIILPIITVMLLFLISIVVFPRLPLSPSNDEKEDSRDSPADEQGTLKGYYFNGYIDIREPFEDFDEATTYMYYMNNHLKDYLNQSVMVQNTEQDEDFIHYFEQLDEPVRPVSFQNKYDLNNGEYVKVIFKGGIMETHPMKIGEVIDVEVVNSTN
ncbi:DUF3221 domain-containing protein [Oceanobacillus sojae]|uniref:DUF3221 domain-containing protein n=1 Tax=Oceanobacillus sojae TaxID=582851 RepID=UPI0021A94CBA|nr:DUF3221 domain-containing protein [Oceanobacillus sojae]MCT1902728.1 DUF3221 domain-containing protein [Oceanobacillus sojae]